MKLLVIVLILSASFMAQNPLDPAIELNRQGFAEYQKQNFEASVELFNKALAANPEFGLAHHNLGSALINLKRYPEAIKSLQSAVRLEPGSAAYHDQLGLAYFESDLGVVWVELFRFLQYGDCLSEFRHQHVGTAKIVEGN